MYNVFNKLFVKSVIVFSVVILMLMFVIVTAPISRAVEVDNIVDDNESVILPNYHCGSIGIFEDTGYSCENNVLTVTGEINLQQQGRINTDNTTTSLIINGGIVHALSDLDIVEFIVINGSYEAQGHNSAYYSVESKYDISISSSAINFVRDMTSHYANTSIVNSFIRISSLYDGVHACNCIADVTIRNSDVVFNYLDGFQKVSIYGGTLQAQEMFENESSISSINIYDNAHIVVPEITTGNFNLYSGNVKSKWIGGQYSVNIEDGHINVDGPIISSHSIHINGGAVLASEIIVYDGDLNIAGGSVSAQSIRVYGNGNIAITAAAFVVCDDVTVENGTIYWDAYEPRKPSDDKKAPIIHFSTPANE